MKTRQDRDARMNSYEDHPRKTAQIKSTPKRKKPSTTTNKLKTAQAATPGKHTSRLNPIRITIKKNKAESSLNKAEMAQRAESTRAGIWI